MQPVEPTDRAVAVDVDGLLDAWRAKAVRMVLAAACILGLPALAAVLSGRVFHLSVWLRVVCILLYLAAAAAALRPRWPIRARAIILLGVLAAFGVIQLAVTQLAGDGKQSLTMLPLLAVILIGPRAGWWMVALGGLLFAAVALLIHGPMAPEPVAMAAFAVPPKFWLLQGMRLMGHMVVLTILLTQFQALQRRTMIAERKALRKLEAETEDRKRLEAEVARVSEAERRNLGSELHDGLCQNLTAALLNCTAMENRHAASGAPEAAAVALIRREIETSIDMAYDVAHGLCPVGLEPAGLAPALEGLCQAARSRWRLACALHVDAHAETMDPDCALQLYRIAGEALANAAKHAECTRVDIRLVRRPGEIELTVSDNGKGLSGETGGGLGRRIMAYRAGLVGGALTISGPPGEGVTVTCRVPDRGGAS